MATQISITIADAVYDEIETLRAKTSIGRSEFIEELIRKGLLQNREGK